MLAHEVASRVSRSLDHPTGMSRRTRSERFAELVLSAVSSLSSLIVRSHVFILIGHVYPCTTRTRSNIVRVCYEHYKPCIASGSLSRDNNPKSNQSEQQSVYSGQITFSFSLGPYFCLVLFQCHAPCHTHPAFS
eukprot:SAG11_NODE_8014_length_1069_cov_2.110309_2_plen_134_part_00